MPIGSSIISFPRRIRIFLLYVACIARTPRREDATDRSIDFHTAQQEALQAEGVWKERMEVFSKS